MVEIFYFIAKYKCRVSTSNMANLGVNILVLHTGQYVSFNSNSKPVAN